MQAVFDKIRAVAATDATVLLLGESGTGKELVARAIHHNSARRGDPFVPVNCAAIPETLLESELFGHEQGAFTGAVRRLAGPFALPLPIRARLLRAVQDKTIRPVGGSQEIQLDVRLVSATHRDLLALVGEGRFRDDLYYRLAVIPVPPPSLRERPDDLLLLASHFLARASAGLGKRMDGFHEDATAW